MEKQELKKIVATRANFTGLKSLISGQLPNADYVLNRIGNRIEALDELRYDSHIASCIQSRKAGVMSHKWEISNSDESSPLLDLIKDVFEKFDLQRIIAEMLEAPLYGYKVLEIIWRDEGGFILPTDIIGKPSEWFYFDYNNMCLFRKGMSNTGEILSPRKFFVIQHNATYKNPYGEALLSKCYWPIFFKKEMIKFWADFAEHYGMPFLVGKVPYGTTQEQKQDLADNLDDSRQGSSIVIEGDDQSVNILDPSKSSSPDLFNNFITFQNSEISKAILSQTLTTELTSTGSFAASKTHGDVRQDIIDADKRIVENCFNKLIQYIAEMNFGDNIELPIFSFFLEEDVDLDLAERDFKLLKSGANIKYTKAYWTRAYGFKDDEIDIVDSPIGAEANTPLPEFADEPTNDNEGLNKLSAAVEPMVNQIVDLISNGNSYDEIQNVLVKLYPKLNTDEVENNIAQAIMLSNAAGQFSKGK